MAQRKIRPGHRIAQLLLSGEPVTIQTIRDMFRNTPVIASTEHKISGYVGDIRKYDQGIVRVVKDGRAVVSYQLVNHREFDLNGQRLTGEALTAVQAAMDATKPVAEVVNPYTAHEVPEDAAEVVTTEAPAAETETVAETAEVAAEVSAPAEEAAEVSEPTAETETTEAPAKPKRNRFSKKAA